jgi:hypothetical protein
MLMPMRLHQRVYVQHDVYTEATVGAQEDGLGSKVVHNMVQAIYNKNHHVYADNFFTSVNLANTLRSKQTYIIGTTRANRKGWPSSLKAVKDLAKTMERGDHKSEMVENNTIQCLVWKDTKPVTLLNTICTPAAMSQVPCRNKDGTRTQITCPEAVRLYNTYMGGVDLFDSRRKTYSCSRKSMKWWLRLYYFIIDAAVSNAYILYKETHDTKPLTLKEFLLEVLG